MTVGSPAFAWLAAVGASLTAGFVATALTQHLRYLKVRRERAEDMQPIFYGRATFHVVVYLRTRPGDDVLGQLRAFRSACDKDARWIYAGKALFTAPARQIGPEPWSAAVLIQYPSRAAYKADAARPKYRAAIANFEAVFMHGLRRPILANLLLPQALLLAKVSRRVGSPELTAVSEQDVSPEQRVSLDAVSLRLRDHGGFGARAAVVFNISRRGTPEQRATDRRYTAPMLRMMAERGYGPLHIGRPEALPADISFDQVAIVYYPSADYFADLITSRFYQGIFPSKQLGDNQSVITVPLTRALEANPAVRL